VSAASAPFPSRGRDLPLGWPTPERAHTRIRPSVLRLPKSVTRSARVIVGFIAQRSIGWGNVWADIDAKQCEKQFPDIRSDYAGKILGELVNDGLVRCEWVKGRLMYALNLRPQGELEGVGRCRACGKLGMIDLDDNWRAVPHGLFLEAPKVCDAVELACLGIIADETMGYDKIRRWPLIVPRAIDVKNFKASGYRRSRILAALARLEKLKYIGVKRSVGKPTVYWLIPENFGSGPQGRLRTITGSGHDAPEDVDPQDSKLDLTPALSAGKPSSASGSHWPAALGYIAPVTARSGSEEVSKVETAKRLEVAEPAHVTSPIEFLSAPVGWCRNCRTYGPVDLVSEAPEHPEGSTFPDSLPPPVDKARYRKRAGPPAPAKPVEKWVAPPELRDLYAFLLTIPAPELPDETVTREISAGLQGSHLETLQARCKGRAESIRRAEHPFKYIAAIARGIGAKYSAAENVAVDAAARQRESELAGIRELSLEEAREWFARPELLERFRPLLLEAFPELAQ